MLIDSLTTLPQNRDAGHAILWVATERLGAANLTTLYRGPAAFGRDLVRWPGRRDHLHPQKASRRICVTRPSPTAAYAAVVLVLLAWAPVPAASDPVTAGIGRFAGNHQRTGTGGYQDEPAAPARVLERELLGERTAPRQSQDVNLGAAGSRIDYPLTFFSSIPSTAAK